MKSTFTKFQVFSIFFLNFRSFPGFPGPFQIPGHFQVFKVFQVTRHPGLFFYGSVTQQVVVGPCLVYYMTEP